MPDIGPYSYSEADLIGEGAFAAVFKGRHRVTGAPVAVKRVPAHCVKSEELELVRSLDSDFVVRIFDVFRQDETAFIVMELCDATLAAHLERRLEEGKGPLRLENIKVLIYCLAQGYAAINRARILHRDLKPENILICYKPDGGKEGGLIGTAKIADFGSSRLSHEEEERRGLAGTPLYMAPEVGANVVADSAYGAQVDMWSLGVLLFHGLTGQVPFDEGRLCKLFLWASTQSYAAYSPPELPPDTPANVAGLIQGLLRLDPAARTKPEELEAASREFRPLGAADALRRDSGHWRHFLIKNILTYFRDLIL